MVALAGLQPRGASIVDSTGIDSGARLGWICCRNAIPLHIWAYRLANLLYRWHRGFLSGPPPNRTTILRGKTHFFYSTELGTLTHLPGGSVQPGGCSGPLQRINSAAPVQITPYGHGITSNTALQLALIRPAARFTTDLSATLCSDHRSVVIPSITLCGPKEVSRLALVS